MDFARQREAVRMELDSLRHNISANEREIQALMKQSAQLHKKLADLNTLEAKRTDMGLEELVRMCKTPCLAFVPIDPVCFLYGKIRR